MCNCFRFFSVITLLLCIVGCGFQLKGSIPQSAKNSVMLQAKNPNELIVREISNVLAYHEMLAANDAADVKTLVVDDEQISNQVVEYSAGGEPQKFRLTCFLDYKIIGSNGQELLPKGKIERSREFSQSPNELIAGNTQQNQMLHEINHEIAIDLARQLANYT